MTYLALDKTTGDLIKSEGGGVARVTDGRFVVQQVQSKLRTFFAEWIPDPSIGWLSLEDFEKNFDQYSIERRARKIITDTQGVLAINSLSSTLTGRKLILQFTAETTYGVIDLTIPWRVQ